MTADETASARSVTTDKRRLDGQMNSADLLRREIEARQHPQAS